MACSAWLVILATAVGCNVVGNLAAGPTAGKAGSDRAYGGDVLLTAGLDAASTVNWADCKLGGQCEPKEVAGRGGIADGMYVRGTDRGFAIGGLAGFFVGSTSKDAIFLLTGAGRVGLQTLHGAHAAVGAIGAFTAGFTIDKHYQKRFLCRSLTYLTATLAGTIDVLPGIAGQPTLPSLSLLIGVGGVDDTGAPSDRAVRDAHCPR